MLLITLKFIIILILPPPTHTQQINVILKYIKQTNVNWPPPNKNTLQLIVQAFITVPNDSDYSCVLYCNKSAFVNADVMQISWICSRSGNHIWWHLVQT
jgi:hypothetical protein